MIRKGFLIWGGILLIATLAILFLVAKKINSDTVRSNQRYHAGMEEYKRVKAWFSSPK
jgi:hypothetical protein